MWAIVFLLFNIIVYFIYSMLTRKYDYWKKKNVQFLPPQIIFGNYKDYMLLKTFVGNVAKRIYEQFPDEPYVGVYYGTEPTLLVQDPELLKLIMSKDFYYFHGREVSNYAKSEAITQAIFFHSGDYWKVVRQSLTPLFTSAKLKNMFPLIVKCTHTFDKLLERETSVSSCIDTYTLVTRFMIDCVGTCAFGIDINLMQNGHDNNPFRKLGELILGNNDIRGYKNIMRAVWPKLFYALGLQTFPPGVKKTIVEIFTNVFKLRDNKPTARNDFVDLMLSLKENKYFVGDSINSMKNNQSKKALVKFDDEIMSGQCAAFIAGGYETSSTTLTLILFELAKHKKYQLIVQREVDEYLQKHDNKLEYDCLTEMPYVAACFDETLRLYPAFTNITREVMEDYTLPTGLQLDKGIRIHIPVYYIHRNPRNFHNPDQYQPERFLPENRHTIKPYTYLPFGEGPRTCTGMRFARLPVFAGLITIMKKYDISLADGMSTSIDISPRMSTSHTTEEVKLTFKHRKAE